MQRASLSPQTITTYVGVVKLVVASAIDEDGEQLFPRKWNHEFIDMPVIENQHQPIFTPEAVTGIIAEASGQERVLYALLAATGLRMGEAFGLELPSLRRLPHTSCAAILLAGENAGSQNPQCHSASRCLRTAGRTASGPPRPP